MSDVAQFSALAALLIGGFGFVAFMVSARERLRMEQRMDRLEDKVDRLHQTRMDRFEEKLDRLHQTDFPQSRRELAEEFRAQRAEVAEQVSTIASAINAARRQ